MLSDVNVVVEIVEKVFGLKSGDRERLASLLDQISEELTALAEQWQAILQSLQTSDVSSQQNKPVFKKVGDTVIDMRLSTAFIEQRGRYHALLRFVAFKYETNKMSAWTASEAHEMFAVIEAAVSTKGGLIRSVHQIEGLGHEYWARKKHPSKPHWAEYYGIDSEVFVARRVNVKKQRALHDLQMGAEKLAAVAGEFRAIVALYKAGQAG